MITLLVIAYLVVGFIQSSLLHRYFQELDGLLMFVVFTLIWPILTVITLLLVLSERLIVYMEWLRKDKS